MPSAAPQESHAQSSTGWAKLRALVPLLVCIVLGSLIVGWQYHRTQARNARVSFTVLLEGQPADSFEALLDGIPYRSGQPSGVGSKILTVRRPNAETFTTNLFVWYAGASAGTINLLHTRGTLALDVAPSANRVAIRGQRFQKELRNCSQESFQVPVGEYEVVTQFERFAVNNKVTVTHVFPETVRVKPSVTALELKAEPPASQFRLVCVRQESITVESNTPATITGLPTGEYILEISQDQYRKVVSLTLTAEPTNQATVRFDYARVAFNSEPNGAAITDARRVLGTTPATVSFPPGTYELRIEKEGFYSTNINLKLAGTEQREIVVTLANVAFVEALGLARWQADVGRYDRALGEVEKALRHQPSDATALQLKQDITFASHLRAAREFGQTLDFDKAFREINLALNVRSNDASALELRSGLESAKQKADNIRRDQAKQDAEAAHEKRKKHLVDVFATLTARVQHADLFPTQSLIYKGLAKTARESLLRALQSKPQWEILVDKLEVDGGTFIVQAGLKTLFNRKLVVFLGSQTDEAETSIHYKFLDFVPNLNKGESGLREAYKPLHPKFAAPGKEAEDQMSYVDDLRQFKTQLPSELR